MFDFKKKKDSTEFFDLFVESAKYFNQGAQLMDDVMLDHSKADVKVKEIEELEHEADKVNDKLIDKLNQTFITPIDREDIYALANSLDDGVDLLQGTLQRIVMYHTGEPREGAVQLTRLLIEGTQEIIKALEMLSDLQKNQNQIMECIERVYKVESEGDKIFRREIAYLFEQVKDPIELIKWKDILEYLEDTTDHCEEICDLIRGVVMKYA